MRQLRGAFSLSCMRTIGSFFLSFSLLIGCGDAGTSSDGSSLSHTFEALDIESGAEMLDVCQSWTLDNDEPLYVARIEQSNDGAWHHSNWYFVPEELYDGPDGTWPCGERGFTQLGATNAGGVFFAQSTQTFDEAQAFAEGAVVEIPPRSTVVGDIHLLNVSATPLSTAIRFDVETIAEEDVEVKLRPIAFSNEALDIEPRAESRFGMTCNVANQFERVLGEPPNYNIYYVLGHYHDWGNYFRLSFVDEEAGIDETVFEFSGRVGEPLGKVIDPPLHSQGAKSLRFECGYLNDTDRRLEYGFQGQEMCLFLAYMDADIKLGALSGVNQPMGQNENGVYMNETKCGAVVGVPAE
ncbi:MAG: hypothetical protein WBG86_08980 [Polyangiales bacterium]